jgi:hypothetical protein
MTRISDLSVGLREGFRSGLEDKVAEQIRSVTGLPAEYEQEKIRYTKPQREAKYTPDFKLPNGIIIETKGRLVTDDRQKHLLIKAQHPALDIRFVFSNSRQRISKTSETTYADWCQKHGFKFADKFIPPTWFKEPPKR